MSTTADLMGLGMPPALASRLGNNPASVSGVGTTQTGAAALTGGVVLLLTPTSSNTAFILNNATSTGRPIYAWNQSSSQTALVFPPSGGTINGGSANASVSIPPLTGALFQLENGSGVAAESWGAIVGSAGGSTSPSFVSETLTGQSATVTPLTITAGTVNTTPAAGGIEFDGKVFYGDVAVSQRGVIPTESFVYVQSAVTLVSQTAAQAAFVGTSGGVLTNGEITLPVGTYEFVGEFNLSAMSASSGEFGFALGTANSAAIGQQGWSAYANKATLATPATPQFSYNTGASTELATASTATVGFFRVEGTFTLTTAGSIIPEISLTVAAAAIVGVGSYFKIRPLGSQTVANIGDWS